MAQHFAIRRLQEACVSALVVGIAGGMTFQTGAAGANNLQTRGASQRQPNALALTHAAIADLTTGTSRSNMTVLVQDGRITAVAPDGGVSIQGAP